MTTKKKLLLWTIIWLILVCGTFLFPLSRENISMEFCFSNVPNGEEISITLENAAGERYEKEVHIYGEMSEIFLDPDDYECVSIEISGLNEEAVLESIRLYSGNYNTSTDKMAGEITVGQQVADGSLILTGDVCTEVVGIISEPNRALRIKMIILFLAVCMLAAAYHCSGKLGFAKIFLWIFLVLYVLEGFVGDPFGLRERYNTVSNVSDDAVYSMVTDEVEINFTVEESDFKCISIPYLIAPDTIYEDFGVRLIRVENGVEIYSRLFTAEYLKSNEEILFYLPDELGSIQPGEYYVILEPLDPAVESTVAFQFDENLNLEMSYMYGPTNRILFCVIACVILIFLLLFAAFRYESFRLSGDMAVKMIYGIVFVFAIAQVFYYEKYIGSTPDENAHLSYVAYLLEHRTFVPDFSAMPLYLFENGIPIAEEGTINNLGHPSLYYWILALVQMAFGGDQFRVNMLRGVSAGMGMLAIFIFFMIGYHHISRKYPYVHLVYAAACVSVPCMLHEFAGVNNDALSFLGAALAFWGIMRFEKKDRSRVTFLLLVCGLCVTMLSKLTAGLVLVIAYIIYAVYVCLREKRLQSIFCRSFLAMLPFLIVIAAYYGVVCMKYGTIQPTLASMDISYYKNSGFYVEFSDRMRYNVKEYFAYYWSSFLKTWSSIYSHITIEKESPWYGLDRIVYVALLFCPVLLLGKKNKGKCVFCLCVFAGMFAAAWMQFYSAYRNFFFTAGYTGGFQSRYYLCWAPVLAFAFAHLFQDAQENSAVKTGSAGKWIRWLALAVVLLLFYGSFLYTLLTYGS